MRNNNITNLYFQYKLEKNPFDYQYHSHLSGDYKSIRFQTHIRE